MPSGSPSVNEVPNLNVGLNSNLSAVSGDISATLDPSGYSTNSQQRQQSNANFTKMESSDFSETCQQINAQFGDKLNLGNVKLSSYHGNKTMPPNFCDKNKVVGNGSEYEGNLDTEEDNNKRPGSVTPTLSLQCSFGSLGSLDSGHSSELGMGQSASTPEGNSPSSSCRQSPSRQQAIMTSRADQMTGGGASGGTPPNLSNNNTPPNFFESYNAVPAAARSSTPVPSSVLSYAQEEVLVDRRPRHEDELRRSCSRDSGRPVTLVRSDSMGSNTSRKSDASTLSAMSAVSAISSYSAATDFSSLSGLSRNSTASLVSRKSGVSSISGVSRTSHSSGVSHLSDISGLSTSTAGSSRTIQPRKSREELEASIEQLESLWSAEDDWIMIFDKLINNSMSSRPRRHTHSSSSHFAPYRSPHRRSFRLSGSHCASLQSSPYHSLHDPG